MVVSSSAIHTAAEFVYDQLRKKIFEKALTSGQRLPEVAIAKDLNVSRTPVREALRRLESEGLVQIIPGWGACLASPSKQEIIDTYEVREDLETMAIRKAAKRITPLQLCRLQEQIDAERETFVNRDLESYLKVNDNFHIIIAESSGNSTLVGYVKNILSRIFVQMIFFESFFDFDTNPSLEEHIAILNALKEHDEAECVRLMKEHLRLSMEGLKAK
ncbi:GntR family transcriptional regulator [Synergistes jonesii]|uniref:GntR family transcriptional regulator n=1 Tax=Synergistes jonesii TaxID=2754 RepID=A0A073IR30_9BACT|nr:GntR family transcriptional regulator [Synergistes jonesii]KEJ92224.1 GntR family transcriptional regulator [Synergistes jonesii]MDY2985215.1 GntR family transcriptional regulator [Synergistes jonesii]OFB62676.1 GntR family transcriptional regulator [Synergistes jonesii]OFB63383.1 GntR family transcriptional regulator [Synergistes jonesii]OFB65574.1 GntR family transcriptional regulator [Synergistes jonesii]